MTRYDEDFDEADDGEVIFYVDHLDAMANANADHEVPRSPSSESKPSEAHTWAV